MGAHKKSRLILLANERPTEQKNICVSTQSLSYFSVFFIVVLRMFCVVGIEKNVSFSGSFGSPKNSSLAYLCAKHPALRMLWNMSLILGFMKDNIDLYRWTHQEQQLLSGFRQRYLYVIWYVDVSLVFILCDSLNEWTNMNYNILSVWWASKMKSTLVVV